MIACTLIPKYACTHIPTCTYICKHFLCLHSIFPKKQMFKLRDYKLQLFFCLRRTQKSSKCSFTNL